MNLEDSYNLVEAACPGFFAGLDLIVTGVNIEDVANRYVDLVDSEVKVHRFGKLLQDLQARVNCLTPEDVVYLDGQAEKPFCALLLKKHRLQSLKRTGGFLAVSQQDLGEGLDTALRMRQYADACRFLLGTLYRRAHHVEHHWDEYPA